MSGDPWYVSRPGELRGGEAGDLRAGGLGVVERLGMLGDWGAGGNFRLKS